MDVTADVTNDSIDFLNFRGGLYGRTPSLNFRKRTSNKGISGSDVLAGAAVIGLGAIIYEENRKAQQRDRDRLCAEEGYYRTQVYYGRDNYEGVRYTLALQRGSVAEIIIEPFGYDRCDNRFYSEYGSLFRDWDYRSPIRCNGTYRREGGRVIIDIVSVNCGRGFRSVRTRLCGDWRDGNVFFNDYDRGYFGSRPAFRFDHYGTSYEAYRPQVRYSPQVRRENERDYRVNDRDYRINDRDYRINDRNNGRTRTPEAPRSRGREERSQSGGRR
jgi:hypothetical protein